MFGRFEAADPNELWCRGRTPRPAGRDRKTYLFAFLDDLPVGGGLQVRLRRSTVRLARRSNQPWPPAGCPAGGLDE